jgi:hypothetical protein
MTNLEKRQNRLASRLAIAALAFAFLASALPCAAADPDPEPQPENSQDDDCGVVPTVTPYGGRYVVCAMGYEYDTGEALCLLIPCD